MDKISIKVTIEIEDFLLECAERTCTELEIALGLSKDPSPEILGKMDDEKKWSMVEKDRLKELCVVYSKLVELISKGEEIEEATKKETSPKESVKDIFKNLESPQHHDILPMPPRGVPKRDKILKLYDASPAETRDSEENIKRISNEADSALKYVKEVLMDKRGFTKASQKNKNEADEDSFEDDVDYENDMGDVGG